MTNNPDASSKRIFISYKRNCVPDEPIALSVFKELSQQNHRVFIDQESIEGGADWANRIAKEICEADFVLAFISSASVPSEMFEDEVELAHLYARENNGSPAIIPIRLKYSERLHYPLSSYLNHIQWISWQSDEDTPRLVKNVQRAVSGFRTPVSIRPSGDNDKNDDDFYPPFASAQIEEEDGALDPQGEFYEMRLSDLEALKAIRQQGKTITIKGPRQIGKSSLLIRVKEAALAPPNPKTVVLLDFQLIEKPILSNADSFFSEFCELITFKLQLESKVSDYWKKRFSYKLKCTQYMEEYVLPQMSQPLVLAMDEVDKLSGTSFKSDFFSMLRSWHNSRADVPIWKNLDLVLVTSTEPFQLIEDTEESPFNVGTIIEPEDFSEELVIDLIRRYVKKLSSVRDQKLIEPLAKGEPLKLFMDMFGGHPYLVRRALYLIASRSLSIDDLFKKAATDRGPFGDHLRRHLFRLRDKADLVEGLLQVIKSQICDDTIAYRLQSAGLVRRESKKKVLPRCGLYKDYFEENLP